MTKKEQNELIEQLIDQLSVAGLTCRIAAICTVRSYQHAQKGNDKDDHSADVWQEAAEAILEASYKCAC